MKIKLTENGQYSQEDYEYIYDTLVIDLNLDTNSASREDEIITVKYPYAKVELNCDFPERSAVYFSDNLMSIITSETNMHVVMPYISELSKTAKEVEELVDEFEYIVANYDWE